MTKYVKAFILASICLLVMVSAAVSATPTLLFSDLTDGPISGWDGSGTKGAAVTVWGWNFGTAQAGSYLTVCGQTIQSTDSNVIEWNQIDTVPGGTDPNDVYASAIGMPRITFHLNSSMDTGAGTIQVTTSDGSSQTIPFYARNTGNIYFVADSDGSDSYDGTRSTYQSGTTGPWGTPGYARENISAGDIFYIRTGTYTDGDQQYSSPYAVMEWRGGYTWPVGTSNNSCAVVAYPGEYPVIGSESNGKAISFRASGSNEGTWSYWVISKLTLRADRECAEFSPGSSGAFTSHDHIRLVGCDVSTMYGTEGAKSAIGLSAGDYGESYVWVLGNNIHDVGHSTRDGAYGGGSFNGYPVYIKGYGDQDHIYIGHNEMSHSSHGRVQIYGHILGDSVDYIYIYGNYIHDLGLNSVILGGGDGADYYQFVQNMWFYNNIISNCESGAQIASAPYSHGENGGGSYYVSNNIFFKANGGDIITWDTTRNVIDFNNNIVFSDSNTYFPEDYTGSFWQGATNVFYNGSGSIPSAFTGTISANPSFSSATPNVVSDFFPSSESSNTVDAGTTVSYVSIDFYGYTRSTFDIGAFEYEAAVEEQQPSITGGSITGGSIQ